MYLRSIWNRRIEDQWNNQHLIAKWKCSLINTPVSCLALCHLKRESYSQARNLTDKCNTENLNHVFLSCCVGLLVFCSLIISELNIWTYILRCLLNLCLYRSVYVHRLNRHAYYLVYSLFYPWEQNDYMQTASWVFKSSNCPAVPRSCWGSNT